MDKMLREDFDKANPIASYTPPPPPPKRVKKSRPPLDRAFATMQKIAQDLDRLSARVKVWSSQTQDPEVSKVLNKVDLAIWATWQNAKNCTNDIGNLATLGFKPLPTKGTFQPGDQVEIRVSSIDRWLPLAEDPQDLNNLVVIKVVGKDIVVGFDSAGGEHERFAVMPKGMLRLKK